MKRPLASFSPAVTRARAIALVGLLLAVLASVIPAACDDRSGTPLAAGGAVGASNTPDCTDYYYGAGVPQSFENAFECFQGQDDYVWLILLTLNGEGVPQSVKKARELVARAHKNPSCCDGGMLELAVGAIEEREKNRELLKTRVLIRDFICDYDHWNGSTNDIEVCWADFKGYLEVRKDADLKRTAANLSAPAKAALEELNDVFAKFQKADGMWMYLQISGTGSGGRAQLQEMSNISNFASLLRTIVKNHALPRRTDEEFRAKDKDLNAAYRVRIAEVTDDWDSQLKDPARKDDWPNFRKQKSGYLDSAKDAERLWLKLIDPWKRLCEELYRGEMPLEDIDRAIETTLREVRIQEIQCESNCEKDAFGVTLAYTTNP